MRGKWILLLASIIAMLFITSAVMAQGDTTCEADATQLETIVEAVCSATGRNELCYGNNQVSVTARDNAPDYQFTTPGDLMSVDYIQSLYLSALDQAQDLWGVAQMRLVTPSTQGPQDVTLLLFGDVEVENAVEPTTEVAIETTASINVRSFPRLTGAVITSAPRDSELIAIGRLVDTSWVRVLLPDTEQVGWVSTDFVTTVDDSLTLDALDVIANDDAFFRPMQAFYINTGNNLSCDNAATDGLIIQTPSGTARVTFLINEVTVDLISPDGNGATALVQANPDNGLTISVTQGAAEVQVDDSFYVVESGLTVQVDLDENLQPVGEVSLPRIIDADDLPDISVLELQPLNPQGAEDGQDGGAVTGDGDGNGNTPVNDGGNDGDEGEGEGNANGNATGQGTGNATGNATGQGNPNNQNEQHNQQNFNNNGQRNR